MLQNANSEHADRLPPLPLFAICAQTPAVILDKTVYFLADPGGAGGDGNTSAGNFCFERHSYALVRSQSLMEIEAQYLGTYAQELEAYQAHYVQQEVDRQLESMRGLEEQLADYQLLAFLTQQLIPRLKRLESGMTPKIEPAAIQVPSLFSRPRRPPHLCHTVCLLTDLFSQNGMILDEIVYALRPVAPERGQDLVIVLPDQVFGLYAPGRLLTDVAAMFMQRLRQMLEAEALLAAPAYQQRLRAVRALEAQVGVYLTPLAQARDLCLYQGQEWGIIQQPNGWVVYLEVPAYAVEDANGTLYRFDAARVGLLLTTRQTAGGLNENGVHVLTAYEHMFVPRGGRHICMAKGPAYFAALQRQPLAEAVCTYLHDARYTLMAGYYAGNTNTPHQRIEAFPHRRISRQVALQEHLPVFPYHRVLPRNV